MANSFFIKANELDLTIYLLKFPTLINRWKNNSLSNFLCKLVIDKQLISKAKQQNCYGSKNRENK